MPWSLCSLWLNVKAFWNPVLTPNIASQVCDAGGATFSALVFSARSVSLSRVLPGQRLAVSRDSWLTSTPLGGQFGWEALWVF